MMNKICNKIDDRRLPAEWEQYESVLMSWPHAGTDWSYMLGEVQLTFVEIVRTLVSDNVKVVIVAPDTSEPRAAIGDLPEGSVIYADVPTNDTWARDFGVLTCLRQDNSTLLCDFKFNGWGLKFAADRDNLITSRMLACGLLSSAYENHLGFVLEGGSIESDGQGTILTTSECLLSLNRNGDKTKDEIESYLKETLGAKRILWVDHGYLAGDDTDSHIDTLARLAPNNVILYVKCDDVDDEHYEQLHLMEKDLMALKTVDGNNYNLIGLPMPSPIYDEDGNRLPATYANFLITPKSILLPVYGQPANDHLAEKIMKVAFPDHVIHPINCVSLIQQHGSLHCMTMQLPHGTIAL